MTWLFAASNHGWRWESGRKSGPARREALATQLAMLERLPPPPDAAAARRRELIKARAVKALAESGKRPWKRPPRALRRSNPRSLSALEVAMRELCLTQAKERKLDPTKVCWFNKAQMAAALQVPEHFVAQVVHLWNRQGICSQGENNGMHDSHRDRHWGGPWVSCWQDTRYDLRLDRLAAADGLT